MYHKPTKPNPKKDKTAQRRRNTLYWLTGGRQRRTLVICRDCLKAMKKDKTDRQKSAEEASLPIPQGLNANLKCEGCKKKNELRKTTKTKDATAK